jgi:hypothetical protein
LVFSFFPDALHISASPTYAHVSLPADVAGTADANPATQYLNAIWNVVNFEEAERRFVEATRQA